MPTDGQTTIDPIIAGGAQVLSQGINAIVTSRQNELQREYNTEMYERQRQDALADWQRQNEYNSPAAQMERYKAAKLNPNLIYGSATNNSAQVRSSTPQAWNPTAPQFNAASVLGSYYDTKIKQAQYDNLLKQNQVLANESILKNNQALYYLANAGLTGVRADTGRFDLGMKESLANTYYETKRFMLNKIQNDIQYTVESTDRLKEQRPGLLSLLQNKIAETAASTGMKSQQTRNLMKQYELLEKEGKLKDFNIGLQDSGLDTNSPWFLKMAKWIIGQMTKP